MEVLRIKVYLTEHIAVDGHADKAVMLPFTGECAGPLFTGQILPGGVDTQRITPEGRGMLCARYALEGVDDKGQPCRLFIENVGEMAPDGQIITHPTLRTDSESLRWLETAALTGRIEACGDHIEIVITSADTAQVKHIALHRAGLTLRGVLEKKVDGPCPLVLMLYGFGGRLEEHPGCWFQEWSDALTDAGFATLRFDFGGHGQSTGRFREMTPFSLVEDGALFLQYARSLPDVKAICLLGHSQGGVIAGMLAGYYHDAVERLVMLAPAASLKSDAQQGVCLGAVYDPQHIPEAVRVGVNQVGGLYFRVAQTLPIYEVTGQFHGDALAIIGGQDNVVHAENIRRYGECMSNCRVVEMPTLDHGLFGAEHDTLLREVVDFLKKGAKEAL